MLDAEERIVAQSDAIPANWARPTTGWLPGEYITDEHTLAMPVDAPDGEYRIVAGMYTPSGGRLTTPSGGDIIPVTDLAVERQ